MRMLTHHLHLRLIQPVDITARRAATWVTRHTRVTPVPLLQMDTPTTRTIRPVSIGIWDTRRIRRRTGCRCRDSNRDMDTRSQPDTPPQITPSSTRDTRTITASRTTRIRIRIAATATTPTRFTVETAPRRPELSPPWSSSDYPDSSCCWRTPCWFTAGNLSSEPPNLWPLTFCIFRCCCVFDHRCRFCPPTWPLATPPWSAEESRRQTFFFVQIRWKQQFRRSSIWTFLLFGSLREKKFDQTRRSLVWNVNDSERLIEIVRIPLELAGNLPEVAGILVRSGNPFFSHEHLNSGVYTFHAEDLKLRARRDRNDENVQDWVRVWALTLSP